MAAKKKTAPKKTGAKKSSAKKKAAPKKRAAPKKKSTPKKKASAKKKAAPKKKATPAKAAAAKKKTAGKKESTPKKATARGSASSNDVNLGHIFALRPRVNTSFRPNDFMTAKRALSEERYSGITDAARAVAEKALALTRGDNTRIEPHPRR